MCFFGQRPNQPWIRCTLAFHYSELDQSGTGFPSNNLLIKVQGEHQNNKIILSPSLVVLRKKIFKSFFDSRDYLSCSVDLKRPEKPEDWVSDLSNHKTPEEVVDDFNSAKDGEASEKSHGASYKAQLGFHCHLWIITNMSSRCHTTAPFHPSQSHHRLTCQSRCAQPQAVHAPALWLEIDKLFEIQKHLLWFSLSWLNPRCLTYSFL